MSETAFSRHKADLPLSASFAPLLPFSMSFIGMAAAL
jgi:hypothetical protein